MAVTRVINIEKGLLIDTDIGGDMTVIDRPTYLIDPKLIDIPLGFISEGNSRNVELATVEDKI